MLQVIKSNAMTLRYGVFFVKIAPCDYLTTSLELGKKLPTMHEILKFFFSECGYIIFGQNTELTVPGAMLGLYISKPLGSFVRNL